MKKYKTITFAEGYNKPFANFKEDFENLEIFKEMLPEQREKELEIAYKIATDGNAERTTQKSKKPE